MVDNEDCSRKEGVKEYKKRLCKYIYKLYRQRTVFDVFPTGANHVLEVITEEKKHILMPYIKECILEVKLDEEKIVVHLLNGLLDIYN